MEIKRRKRRRYSVNFLVHVSHTQLNKINSNSNNNDRVINVKGDTDEKKSERKS